MFVVTLESIKPVYDMEEKDKVSFILLDDEKTLKILTTCYCGAKSNENLILLERNKCNESIFNAVLLALKKT